MVNLLKTDSKRTIIYYSIAIGISAWICESVVEFALFTEGSFWEVLIFGISYHEIFMRLLLSLSSVLLYLILIKSRIIKEKEIQTENILDNVIPVCITNKEYTIIMANDPYWKIFGEPDDKRKAIKCYEHRPGISCHTADCALTQIIKGAKEYVGQSTKEYQKVERNFIVTARPYLDSKQKPIGIIESFQDITALKLLEKEKEKLIEKLQESLEKVKLLSGFLPICASCKKIRDDQGYWKQIESYIRDHSEAEFSHGICPDCAKKLYPGVDINDEEEKT
jgi:PAS domain-containing protein